MGAVDWPRRVGTVLVGVPSALALLSSDVGMWLLASGLCVGCVLEFATNLAPRIAQTGSRGHAAWLLLLSVGVCAAACTGKKLLHDAALALAVVLSCGFHLSTISRVDLPALTPLLLDVLALVFLVNGFGHAILLRYASRFGFGLQVLGLACAWLCDTGALVVGRLAGRRPLAVVVSPGKTLVGAIAGVLSSVATVVLLFGSMPSFLPSGVGLGEQVVLGIALGVLCILGDLVESLLKRVADVKDSGTFFPGHGGCLDRMDSFLFVAPALWFFCELRLPKDS